MAAAKTTRSDPKLKKAKRQKTFIAVGGVALVIILIIQVPRTMKMLSPPEPAPSSSSSAVGAAGAALDPALDPVATGLAKGKLPDRNAQPEASDGQLVSFELFTSKDPFVQQVRVGAGVPTAAAPQQTQQPGQPGQPGTPGQPAPPAGAATTPPVAIETPMPTAAVISVNGEETTVQRGKEFPEDEPTFVLAAVKRSSVKIGIAGGSLATGADTITLRRGKTLTLVNTADGTEYRLRLVSLS